MVHFAVSSSAVAMTTHLAGAETRFLPFNRGHRMGAGNPPNPKGAASAYLWEEVLAKDNWLGILGRFIHYEKKTKKLPDGSSRVSESIIFPRYHQWQVVRALLSTAKEEGPGRKYLIQHSAGSGKSNSIAWLAHQLIGLHDAKDKRLFDKVIVVTDRTVLDQQLQETIAQFERSRGVVQAIKRDENGGGTKSDKLGEALGGMAGIIVVTIQTFPFVLDAIRDNGGLKEKRFAVIADEAHSSQSGATAQKLREVLTATESSDTEMSADEIIAATLEARKQPINVSFFAFTATPKAKTLEIFGRRPKMDQPASEGNLPRPFHLYSMKQAVEEGFILDVLKNYTTYSAAFRLGAEVDKVKHQRVEARKGRKELMKWARLHPHNISQKVQIIVEHFRAKVAAHLKGQAKAMVVCSGRPDAVRYKLAIDKYLKEQGYANLRTLVAFSGEVIDQDLEGSPFTEGNMNKELRGMDLREAFDGSEYQLMLVANKFQTGFDQPKLCAMYVDKKLSGVDCVQTLSRLNRTTPGKTDTFILDFVNSPDDIKAAFAPYYGEAELLEASDPNDIYDLQSKLLKAGVFDRGEVDLYAEAFFDKKSTQALLSARLQPAVDRFKDAWKRADEAVREKELESRRCEEAGDAEGHKTAEDLLKHLRETRNLLEVFKKDVNSYSRFYEFISQVADLEDAELEKLSVFCRGLYPHLRIGRDGGSIDLSEVEMTHYRLNFLREQQIKLGNGMEVGEESGEYKLKPPTAGGATPKDPTLAFFAELLEKLNDLFIDAKLSDEDRLNYIKTVADKVRSDLDLMDQVNQNSRDQVLRGNFPDAVSKAVMESFDNHQSMATSILSDERILKSFAAAILDLLIKQRGA